MTQKDIAACMVTVDRSPKKNYLPETLENLQRSGMLDSERLGSFTLADSGPGEEFATETIREFVLSTTFNKNLELVDHDVELWVNGPEPDHKRVPNVNVAMALKEAARIGETHDARWVLFLEDDIDVIDRFFYAVGLWLDLNAQKDRHVYAFGANYPQVQQLADAGRDAWHLYPIDCYYGTQAFAVSLEDARDLSAFLLDDPFVMNPDGAAWDLAMHRWAKARWPEIEHFSTSCPSFVEHTGRESVIAPRDETHRFPSWPGTDWRYEPVRPKRLSESANRVNLGGGAA